MAKPPVPCIQCGAPIARGTDCPACKRPGYLRDRRRGRARDSSPYNDPTYRKVRKEWVSRGGTCAICGEYVRPGTGHIDHDPPVSRAVDWRATTLRLTHATCNLKRGAGRGARS